MEISNMSLSRTYGGNKAASRKLIYAAKHEDMEVVSNCIFERTSAQKMPLLSVGNSKGHTPVHQAARYNKEGGVVNMLLDKLDTEQRMTLLHIRDKYEYAPLHLAARYNKNADVINIMLDMLDTEQRMTSVSMKTNYGSTSLHLASRHNENANSVTTLLDKLDAEQRMALLSTRDKSKYTPLHLAARYNKNEDLVTALLDKLHTEHKMTLLSIQSDDGMTPLHTAAQYHQSADVMVSMLETLNTERTITLLCMRSEGGLTPLHLAARYDQSADVMRSMLETLDTKQRMTLLCMRSDVGFTPMHLAARYDQSADVMRSMLETLDTKQKMTLLCMRSGDGLTPMHLVARYDQSADVMRSMLESLDTKQRMTLLCMRSGDGLTPMHLVARYDQSADVMRSMLESLDTELRMTLLCMRSEDGLTPLHLAARYDQSADVMRSMLETLDTEQKMTLLCMRSGDGLTPMHLAARYDQSADVMRSMLETLDTEQKMTLLSRQSDDQMTILHMAAPNNQSADVMRSMLETLDIEQRMTLLCMRSDDGLTPLHLAARYDQSAYVMRSMLETLDTEQKITLLSMRSDDRMTPLHIAARYNESGDVMRSMLEALDTERKMTVMCVRSDRGMTPLHTAARYNQSADVIRSMLETLSTEQRISILHGKDVNLNTPVYLAARYIEDSDATIPLFETLNAEQISTLLAVKDKVKRTPIHMAALNNNTSVMIALLGSLDIQQRMSFLYMKDSYKLTPLHLAVMYTEDTSAIVALFDTVGTWSKLNLTMLDSKTCDINSIFCLAARDTGNSDYLVVLLNNLGVDGRNVLYRIIMESADKKMLVRLLDHAGNQAVREDHVLMWRDAQGNNVLHLAAATNHTNFIRKLLFSQNSIEINHALLTRNSDGFIPYYLAKHKGLQNLLAWAETQGDCYTLIDPPRIVIFYSDQDRSSAQEERDSLVHILPAFCMTPVVKLNPTKEDIFSIIRENQEGEVSALIVVIMSHGDSGVVRVRDGDLSIHSIIKKMNWAKLRDTPKVLILQTCQAQLSTALHYDNRISINGSGVHQRANLSKRRSNVFDACRGRQSNVRHFDVSGPNIIVLAATINEQVASRNIMIPVLAKTLRQSEADEDMYSVFIKTVDAVRNYVPSQTPEFRSTMRHKICLRKIFNPDKTYKSSVKPTLSQRIRQQYKSFRHMGRRKSPKIPSLVRIVVEGDEKEEPEEEYEELTTSLSEFEGRSSSSAKHISGHIPENGEKEGDDVQNKEAPTNSLSVYEDKPFSYAGHVSDSEHDEGEDKGEEENCSGGGCCEPFSNAEFEFYDLDEPEDDHIVTVVVMAARSPEGEVYSLFQLIAGEIETIPSTEEKNCKMVTVCINNSLLHDEIIQQCREKFLSPLDGKKQKLWEKESPYFVVTSKLPQYNHSGDSMKIELIHPHSLQDGDRDIFDFKHQEYSQLGFTIDEPTSPPVMTFQRTQHSVTLKQSGKMSEDVKNRLMQEQEKLTQTVRQFHKDVGTGADAITSFVWASEDQGVLQSGVIFVNGILTGKKGGIVDQAGVVVKSSPIYSREIKMWLENHETGRHKWISVDTEALERRELKISPCSSEHTNRVTLHINNTVSAVISFKRKQWRFQVNQASLLSLKPKIVMQKNLQQVLYGILPQLEAASSMEEKQTEVTVTVQEIAALKSGVITRHLFILLAEGNQRAITLPEFFKYHDPLNLWVSQTWVENNRFLLSLIRKHSSKERPGECPVADHILLHRDVDAIDKPAEVMDIHYKEGFHFRNRNLPLELWSHDTNNRSLRHELTSNSRLQEWMNSLNPKSKSLEKQVRDEIHNYINYFPETFKNPTIQFQNTNIPGPNRMGMTPLSKITAEREPEAIKEYRGEPSPMAELEEVQKGKDKGHLCASEAFKPELSSNGEDRPLAQYDSAPISKPSFSSTTGTRPKTTAQYLPERSHKLYGKYEDGAHFKFANSSVHIDPATEEGKKQIVQRIITMLRNREFENLE